MLKLNLQLFAEESAGAAQATPAVQGQPSAESAGVENQAPSQNQAPARPSFEELIKGEYRQDYEARVQQAIQQRFRNQQNLQKRLEAYTPIMQALSQKYGKSPEDVDGIAKLLTDDDSLYLEEANRMGVPVGTLKQMKQLEAKNARLEAERQQNAQDAALRQHFQRVSQQAEDLKKTFPTFDLMQEMQNPRFARMTGPEVGMSVKDAYYAIHGEEIRAQSMQEAARQAGQRLAASVQAGQNRPVENGAGHPGAVNMGMDISRLSKAQRQEIRRRIHNGETGIDFRNKY